MKLRLTFVFTTIVIFLQGCGFNQNEDNTIYLPDRKFEFLIYYFNQDDSLLKVDALELKVTDGFYPQRSQTAIEWTHYQSNKGDTTIVKESTGLVDGPDYFFIHPPREGDLYVLSFAEFPSLKTSVFEDTTIQLNSSGTVTMVKSYKGKTITNVETTQKYQGKTSVDIPFKKNYRLHHLKASAKSEVGTIYGNYYFSEDLGFVRMDYDLADRSRISIRLSGIDFEMEEE